MKALIVFGGWDGHEPGPVSQVIAKALRDSGVQVDLSDALDSFNHLAPLLALDLIVPVWTMGNKDFDTPPVLTILTRGMLWAAEGRLAAESR